MSMSSADSRNNAVALGVGLFNGVFSWFWVFAITFSFPSTVIMVVGCVVLTIALGIPLIAVMAIAKPATNFCSSIGYASPFLLWAFFSYETTGFWFWSLLTATALASGAVTEVLVLSRRT